MANDIIVIGVDPGSRKVGFGVIEYKPDEGVYRHIESGTIQTAKDAGLTDRLEYIYDEFLALLKKQKALNRTLIIAQERFFTGRLRNGDMICKACGVLQLAGRKAEVDHYVEVNKITANKAVVGRGGSKKKKVEKHHVQAAVKRKLGLDKEMGFDESDALAVALTVIQADLNDKRIHLLNLLKTQREKSK